MQTALDRVFRSFSLKPLVAWADQPQRETARDQAEAAAGQLLENFKAQLVRSAAQPH